MAQKAATGTRTLRDRLLVDPRQLPLAYQLGLVGLVLIAIVPFPLSPAQVSGLTAVLYLMMFAMSWDFFSGYTGQISLGHTIFFAVGGYTSAVLDLEYGLSPAIGIPTGMLLAALAGVLVGVPALRLRRPYLPLITLIVPLVLLQAFVVYDGIFAGRDGLEAATPLFAAGESAVVTVGDQFTGAIATYYASFLVFLLMLAVMLAITRSDVGDVFTAIREDEGVVASVGLDPAKFKIFAFVVSAAAGGLAGAMFVHTAGDALPANLLTPDVAIEVIVVTIIGGMGTIVGAAVGAILYALANSILDAVGVTIPLLGQTPGQLEPLPLYLVAALFLLFLPEGVYGWALSVIRRLSGEQSAEGSDEPSAVERTVEKYKEDLRERL